MMRRKTFIESACTVALASVMLTGSIVLPHPAHPNQCLHLEVIASASEKYPKTGVLDLTKPITISDMNTGKNYTLGRGRRVRYTCSHGVIRIKPLSDHYAVNGSTSKFFNSGHAHQDGDKWVTPNGRRIHHFSDGTYDSGKSHHSSKVRRAKALRAKRARVRKRAKLRKERKLKAERAKRARARRHAKSQHKSKKARHKAKPKKHAIKEMARKPKQAGNYKKKGAVRPTSQHPGSTNSNEKLPRTSEATPSHKTAAETGMAMTAALAAELASPFRSLKKDNNKH